jgi:hypothetical protein
MEVLKREEDRKDLRSRKEREPCSTKKKILKKGRPEEEKFVKKQIYPDIQRAYPLTK